MKDTAHNYEETKKSDLDSQTSGDDVLAKGRVGAITRSKNPATLNIFFSHP